MTDLGQLQANWLVALGQKGRAGARKTEKQHKQLSLCYATHDGRKEAANTTVGTSSSALQKGLLAWVQGQMASAWAQHLSNTPLKQKPPDSMKSSHQNVCVMYTFEFKTSLQS